MMHQIDFYHLSSSDFIKPAVQIAEKALLHGKKTLILVPENKVSDVSVYLWSEKTDSFLAHGMKGDDLAEFSSIWLSSSSEENPISATYVILTNGILLDELAGFERVFNLFDGQEELAKEKARNQWRNWSANTHNTCRYFTQTQTGGWQHTA